MIMVGLEQEEWNRVLAILSQAPWNAANPLIMRIGEQLRAATTPAAGSGSLGGLRQGNNTDLEAAILSAANQAKPQ